MDWQAPFLCTQGVREGGGEGAFQTFCKRCTQNVYTIEVRRVCVRVRVCVCARVCVQKPNVPKAVYG